jgi:hypothetical protein
MMKAVVICEDHQLDEYIIRPVIKRIFAEHRRKVDVTFVPRTLVRGVAEALQKSKLKIVLDRYGMADAFFLIVDRDCQTNREAKVSQRLVEAADADKTLFACIAIEELEVWALALHRKQLKVDWTTIRSNCDPKSNYFKPFIVRKRWETTLGQGRKTALANLTAKWSALKNSCSEIADLSEQVREWLDARRDD